MGLTITRTTYTVHIELPPTVQIDPAAVLSAPVELRPIPPPPPPQDSLGKVLLLLFGVVLVAGLIADSD